MMNFRKDTHFQSSTNEQGQAIVLMAFTMIGMLAFLALAIDGGNTLTERRRAQNAADSAVLAGARTLWIQRTTGNEFETSLLQSINSAAEANGIEDSDAIPGNHVNNNVQAIYTDREGVDLPGPIEVGALGVIPRGAEGIRIIARREFHGYFSNMIGHPILAADAGATAVIIPPKGCGNFAIYAGCTGDCQQNVLDVTESSFNIIGGGIHSNADIHIGGGGQGINIYDGFIEYVTECQGCDTKVTIVNGAQPTQVQPSSMPELWEISDFQPTGSAANQAGAQYYYVNGDLDELINGDGLYYVSGNIELHEPVGNVTLVAEGTIKITGSANVHTFRQQWPIFFSNSSNSQQGAVQISGSDALWTGFVYAPNGLVSISAASNSTLQGAIYANEVDLAGAQAGINYDPAFCPPTRARVILFK